MKIIITTIILTLFSSLSFADGHTSGKFNASGMGAWEVNVMNAGKGDMSVTYDGIAGLIDDTPESIFHKSTMHCIGGLTLQAGAQMTVNGNLATNNRLYINNTVVTPTSVITHGNVNGESTYTWEGLTNMYSTSPALLNLAKPNVVFSFL